MPATLEAESTLTKRDQTKVLETVRRGLRLSKRLAAITPLAFEVLPHDPTRSE